MMAFRNVVVESPARIYVKNRQLVVATDAEHALSPEDLSALLIESQRTTISTAALSLLGQCGCAVFVCDERHLPCAVLTPFAQHSRALAAAERQMDAGEVLKKHLWQAVVTAKIQNQARCLRLCGVPREAEGLEAMAAAVRSGDAGNTEAAAALRYFPALFRPGFSRREDNGTNAALNYGYAVLRGCLARHAAVHGFLPMLGLHHRNEYNGFNLADDLMEPFRPVVDLLVKECFSEGNDGLTPEKKRLLFNCLSLDVLSGGQRHSLSHAAERLVGSLVTSLTVGEVRLLLPELVELGQHVYE